MIVHRFMSLKEYNALQSGKIITNNTIHAKKGFKTTSKGFCFFEEDPDEAIHWLSGIVDLDVCVSFEIEEKLLAKTQGKYADSTKFDPSKVMHIGDKIEYIVKNEYCRFWYCLDIVKILSATTKYRDLYPSKDELKKKMQEFLKRGSI